MNDLHLRGDFSIRVENGVAAMHLPRADGGYYHMTARVGSRRVKGTCRVGDDRPAVGMPMSDAKQLAQRILRPWVIWELQRNHLRAFGS